MGLVLIHVMNEAGRRFAVRCIRKGDRYGLNGCLVHDGEEPLVEFLDVTPEGGPGPMAEPGFVARFPARAVLNREADLWLFGRDLAWRLSPDQVRQVGDWVSGRRPTTDRAAPD